MTDLAEDDAPAGRGGVYVPHKPEQRLSIATDRFLRRALVPPFYVTAIHDSDGGQRTQQQRMRDANRGITSGQLDWDVIQGPPYLHVKLELKRGRNGLSEKQEKTVADLTACGRPPVVARTLAEIHTGLAVVGFRFQANVATTLQHCEALLEAWDRVAAGLKDGSIVKPRAPYRKRKAGPRFTWPARAVG